MQALDIIAIFRVQLHKAIFSQAITAVVKCFFLFSCFSFVPFWPHLSHIYHSLFLYFSYPWWNPWCLFLLSSHLYLALWYYLHTVFLYILISLSFSVLLPSPVISLSFPQDWWASCTLPPTSPETALGAHWCSSLLLLSSLHLLFHNCYHSPPLLLCPCSGFLLWTQRVNLMCQCKVYGNFRWGQSDI